jgi:hypothetical protein
MAEFRTFDLGQVIQTAEAIKGMRRHSATEALRDQYFGEQIAGMKADRESKQRAEQVVLGKEKANQIAIKTAQILRVPNPKNYVEQNEPVLVKALTEMGFDWMAADDNAVRQQVSAMQNRAHQELGQDIAQPAPMSNQGKVSADVRGGFLTQEQGDAAINPGMSPYQTESLAIQRQRLAQGNKPAGQFRTLTPAEIQDAGLPVGTSAQIGQDGKIDVLSKREVTGNLSPKDKTVATLKLTTIGMARQQLDRAKAIFEQARKEAGPNAFGPGQGLLPTQQGKRFDAAINQMRGTWTSLKRVPGVGSMSDYESRMDASQFPSRNEWESVIGEKLQGMEDQLALLENGYTGLLSGGSTQQEQPTQPMAPQAPQQQQPPAPQQAAAPQLAQAAPQAPITATGPNGQKLMLQNGQWVPMNGR